MALINCPECKGEVSDKAATCPKCGYAIASNIQIITKNNRKTSPWTVYACLVVIAGIYFLFSALLQTDDIQQKSNQNIGKQKTSQDTIKQKPTKEQILYEKVRKIPAKYVEKNRDGYKELMALNPNNQTYRKKYEHYKNLAENKSNSTSSGSVSTSSSNVYDNQNSKYRADLMMLESAGAFTRDHQTRSILVETSFWNSLDYQKKQGFCYMIKQTYPLYAYSILDKYSGRKLAENSILGEISVIR